MNRITHFRLPYTTHLDIIFLSVVLPNAVRVLRNLFYLSDVPVYTMNNPCGFAHIGH